MPRLLKISWRFSKVRAWRVMSQHLGHIETNQQDIIPGEVLWRGPAAEMRNSPLCKCQDLGPDVAELICGRVGFRI